MRQPHIIHIHHDSNSSFLASRIGGLHFGLGRYLRLGHCSESWRRKRTLFGWGVVLGGMVIAFCVCWPTVALTVGKRRLQYEAQERDKVFSAYTRRDPTLANLQILGLDFAHAIPDEKAPVATDAGDINTKIATWVLTTHSSRLLAQPGIYLTARDRNVNHKELVLIHPHIGDLDIDTARTIRLAWPLLRSEPDATIRVLVAGHPLQVERAAYLLGRLCKNAGKRCEIIVPEIVPVAFSLKASQWRCKSEILRLTWELLLARPATYFQAIPAGGIVQAEVPEPSKARAAAAGRTGI